MNVDHATGLCGGIEVPKRREAAGRGKPREVREPALVDERSREVVIQAVEAEDDDPLAAGSGSPAAAEVGSGKKRPRDSA